MDVVSALFPVFYWGVRSGGLPYLFRRVFSLPSRNVFRLVFLLACPEAEWVTLPLRLPPPYAVGAPARAARCMRLADAANGFAARFLRFVRRHDSAPCRPASVGIAGFARSSDHFTGITKQSRPFAGRLCGGGSLAPGCSGRQIFSSSTVKWRRIGVSNVMR